MGWITINVDIDAMEVINDISTKDLVAELRRRKRLEMTKLSPTPEMSGEDLKRFLCDVVGVNYHISNDAVLSMINDKL